MTWTGTSSWCRSTVLGDAELLERAVTNLVQNAVAHNVPGGSVDVRLSAGAETAPAGRGEHRPLISPEASGRPDPAVPARRHGPDVAPTAGSASGCPIVQAVADHHGGRLVLTPLESGGLAVELELPPCRRWGERNGAVGPGN